MTSEMWQVISEFREDDLLFVSKCVLVFRRTCKIAKSDHKLRHVRPRGTTQLPQENFSKIWQQNSGLTLILLTWRIRWAPNNATRWQMGFILGT